MPRFPFWGSSSPEEPDKKNEESIREDASLKPATSPENLPAFRGIDFDGDDLSGKNFAGADLRYTGLRNVILRNANLQGANLRCVTLAGSNFEGADLSGADLREIGLHGGSMRNAILRDADLRGANVREVDFRGADLRGAKLNATNLSKRELAKTDLALNLRGADLRGANLRDAKIEEASFIGSVYDNYTIWPDGKPPSDARHILETSVPSAPQQVNTMALPQLLPPPVYDPSNAHDPQFLSFLHTTFVTLSTTATEIEKPAAYQLVSPAFQPVDEVVYELCLILIHFARVDGHRSPHERRFFQEVAKLVEPAMSMPFEMVNKMAYDAVESGKQTGFPTILLIQFEAHDRSHGTNYAQLLRVLYLRFALAMTKSDGMLTESERDGVLLWADYIFPESVTKLQQEFEQRIILPKGLMPEDSSSDELLAIFEHFCRQMDYQLAPDARKKALDIFQAARSDDAGTVGNVRYVRAVFDRSIKVHAQRVALLTDITEDMLFRLEAGDISIPLNYDAVDSDGW